MAKSLSGFLNDFFDDFRKLKITPEEYSVAQKFFDDLKKEIIEQILSDPVSQELIHHTNPSQILGIRGTLFGFLGLVEGFDPMPEIVKVVETTMSFTLSKRLIKKGYKMKIQVPTLEDFRTPDLILPWEGGRGLVDAIEKGVSGLGYYIENRKNTGISRSGEGIQTQKRIRQIEFRKRDWITKVFKRVKDTAKNFR